jgi:HSP20 family molecular chaperone IbpA
MTEERKGDEFKEIEEIIQKILERSLSGTGGIIPAGFRIIITGGEIREDRERFSLPISRQVHEPPVEIFTEGDTVRLLAEVPGADLSTTHLQVTGRMLRIYADGGVCRFRTSVELPPVEAETMSSLMIHGVLEVTFRVSPAAKNTL